MNEEPTLFTAEAYESGNSLVITIPHEEVIAGKIKKGDILRIYYKKIKKPS